MLVGLGRVPGDVCGSAVEEIRNEDAVFLLGVGGGEDVCALDGLVEESEDVCGVKGRLVSVFCLDQ